MNWVEKKNGRKETRQGYRVTPTTVAGRVAHAAESPDRKILGMCQSSQAAKELCEAHHRQINQQTSTLQDSEKC